MNKIILLILLAVSLPSLAQKKDSSKVDSTKKALFIQSDFAPQIFPPSPKAAQLGRFGEVPVSLANGTLSYSIPIYEAVSGNLKVPISLDYQGSGLKANDISSEVGTSWVLKAGGAITRSVRGLPDDDAFGYLSHDYPSLPLTDSCYIAQALLNFKDPQPDLWFYNFAGYSGSYIYSRPYDTNSGAFLSNQTPVPILYPHESTLKLAGVSGGQQITDNEGTVYTFDVEERTNANSNVWTSAYYLSKIKNQLGDEIVFSYIDATYTESVYNRILRTKSRGTDMNLLISIEHPQESSSTIYFQKQLADIYFTNGKVHFSYVNDRLDNPTAGRLAAIIIYKKTGPDSYAEIKRHQLTQDYFQGNDEASRADFNPASYSHPATSRLLKRLRLKGIEEIPVAGGPQNPKYSFEYYEGLPLPIHYSMSQDYWGYYNGAYNVKNLLIWDTYSTNNLPNMAEGANRLPNFDYAVLGMLKSITYPTKGKSEFTYELNKGPDNKEAGGLRIKTIISRDNTSNKIGEKNYNYTKPYYTSNIYQGSLNNLVLTSRISYYEDACNCSRTTLNETVYNEEAGLTLGGGSSVAYEEVEEYVRDYNDPSARLGKSRYTFTKFEDFDARPVPNQSINYSWKRGRLLEKEHFRLSGGSETLVSKEVNTYQYTGLPYRATQLSVYNQYRFLPCDDNGIPKCEFANPLCANNPEGVTVKDDPTSEFTHELAESILLQSSETITYDDNGQNPVSSTTNYSYANHPYTQPDKTVFTDSDNRVYETQMKYPYDFSLFPYPQMTARNIIRPVIETIEKTDNIQQYKLVNNYVNFGLEIFVPSSVQTQFGAADPLRTEITFTNYNSYGNPLSWVDKTGSTTNVSYYADSDYGKTRLVKEKITNGQRTFFDHQPLFGLKEMKMPNDLQSFYNYDGLGRLLDVRDHNNNIVDQYGYQYATVSGTGTPSNISYGPNSCTNANGPTSSFFVSVTGLAAGAFAEFSIDNINYFSANAGSNGYTVDVTYSPGFQGFWARPSDNPGQVIFGQIDRCAFSGTTPAPTISITSSSLCNVTLTASGCSGMVNWSNGSSGNSITVATVTSVTYSATCTDNGSTSSASSAVTVPALPAGWNSVTVGNPVNGCTQFTNNELTIQSTGSVGATNQPDNFHYVYRNMSGDFTLIAKVSSLAAANGDRAGIMVRNDLGTTSLDFSLFQDQNRFVGVFRRDTPSGDNEFSAFQEAVLGSTWIRVIKTGNQFQYSFSTDPNVMANGNWDSNFSLVGSGSANPQPVNLNTNFLIGFATWGSGTNVTFSNITINGQPF